MHAPNVYITTQAVRQFANSLMFTTYAIYYIKELGFDPFQLLLIGMFLEGACLLFETPTGVFADTRGRRFSVITGFVIMGAGFVVEGSVPFFEGLIPFIVVVITAEVIRGLGETFVSGAAQAWITDEAGEKSAGDIFLRAAAAAQLAGILGIGASVALSSISLNLPFLAGGLIYLGLAVFLHRTMKEHNFKPAVTEGGFFSHGFDAFRDGVKIIKASAILSLLVGISFLLGAATEGWDRLWEAHFLMNLNFPELFHFNEPAWFGVISLVTAASGYLAAVITRKFVRTENEKAVAIVLTCLTVLRACAILGFCFASDFWMALFWLNIVSMASTVSYPLFNAWINQLIPSARRATILSMVGQMDAFGQIAGGPGIGYIGTRFTLRTSLFWVGILQLPILIAYMVSVRKMK
ncbi:MFS transporter [Peribacillus sp. SCS-26]|uniref:MFS transporter n=1 Tax=Paraperibacillus marinus TaxID=3115295 RepID=UPI0039064B5B